MSAENTGLSLLADSFSHFCWEDPNFSIDTASHEKYQHIQQNQHPKTIKAIRQQLRHKKLFASISVVPYERDTTIFWELLINVIVGPVCPVGVPERWYLLKSVPINHRLKNQNGKEYDPLFIREIFEDAMNLLWPNNVDAHRQDIILLLTDHLNRGRLSLNINSAAKELVKMYPQMVHLLDLSELFHQFQDNICTVFPTLNEVYNRTTNLLTYLSLDFIDGSELISISQKDFLESCNFYLKFYSKIKAFFASDLKEDHFDAATQDDYNRLKELWKDVNESMRYKLEFINEHFHNAILQIRKRIQQKPTLLLAESITVIANFKLKLEHLGRLSPEAHKLSEILNKRLENSGYKKLLAISKSLSAGTNISGISKKNLQLYKKAPLGGINRKCCFPEANKQIESDFVSFPLRYIDCTSVVCCYDNS